MAEVCTLDWHITPMRADRFLDLWEAAAAKAPAYGAKSWSLTRSTDDPLAFRQTMIWENRSDFERYWYSDEIAQARATIIDLYDIPLLPAWHILVAAE
jgi:heme-degrading monooxygenase HmoA